MSEPTVQLSLTLNELLVIAVTLPYFPAISKRHGFTPTGKGVETAELLFDRVVAAIELLEKERQEAT